MRHTITKEDVQPTIDKEKILLAASSATNEKNRSKHLYLKPSNHGLYYLVIYADKLVFDTLKLDDAIAKYNEL